MNVTSLELCKELYGLSGWGGEQPIWLHYNEDETIDVGEWGESQEPGVDWIAPAYSLGYLLRNLPRKRVRLRNTAAGWFCQYQKDGGDQRIVRSFKSGTHIIKRREWVEFGETPEDAACKLAIELFKAGVLK